MAKSKEQREEDIRQRMLRYRQEAEDGNESIFSQMTKEERFKKGGRRQWDARDLDYNDRHHKHSITINRIRPTVNYLSGQQVRNPRDLTALPNQGANTTQARLITALMKRICDSSHNLHQQNMAFDAGITARRGYLAIETTYQEDPNGDLQLSVVDPFSVLPDVMRRKYDPNDWREGWRYVWVDEWWPKFTVETMFPDRKEDLPHARYGVEADTGSWLGGRINDLWNSLAGNKTAVTLPNDYRDYTLGDGEEDEQVSGHSSKWEDHYRVSTCYWRDWRQGAFLQRTDAPDYFRVLYDPRDLKEARRLLEQTRNPQIQLVEKDRTGMPLVVPVLMRTRLVGDLLLDHAEDPFEGIWMYPIVPFNAYFENGQEFGIVGDLIGPQMVCNWSWSMSLSMIQKIVNPGWRIKKALQAAMHKLETHGNEAGFILEEDLYGGKAERLDAPDYQGIQMAQNISERSAIQINESANIRQERPEFDNKAMSGRAILAKQDASDQGSAIIHGNWDMTREILGKTLIQHMLRRGTYTLSEVRQLVDEEDLLDPKLLQEAMGLALQAAEMPEKPPEPPDQEWLADLPPVQQQQVIAQYKKLLQKYAQALQEAQRVAPEMAIQMLWDELEQMRTRRTRFGVKSSLSQTTSTFREAKMIELLALNKILIETGQPPIGRKILVKASDVPYKDEILQEEARAPAMVSAA